MRQLAYFLLYLLILLLPTQLARHFFFDFALVSGLRSDYLAPTIYLTDVIALLLIIVSLRGSLSRAKSRGGNLSIHLSRKLAFLPAGRQAREIPLRQLADRNDKRGVVLLFAICYLLFNSLFIATNKWVAVYKFVKILEFTLLGIVITKLKPKLSSIISVLSISVFYSSLLAVWQFLIQRSVGGIFWFAGERTFYAATPGIAAASPPAGGLLLRPYGTFPHPNVLGGFLALVLPFIFFHFVTNWSRLGKLTKLWFIVSLVAGLAALILSASRVAWTVSLVGFLVVSLERKMNLFKKIAAIKRWVLVLFYFLMLASVVIPLASPKFFFVKSQYWQERVDLVKTTIKLAVNNQPFGVGLNNSITHAKNYLNGFPGLYIFQPVHNIYLLILAETGIVGLAFFLLISLIIFNRIFNSRPIFLYALMQLFLLGLFDHYLVTLQQGQLLLIIFTALSFIPKVAY